jgi:hypothetical protein
LRARGREREAERLERFAFRARLRLDEPKATRRMREFALRVGDAPRLAVCLERALEGAISLAGADFGNVQIRDRVSGELRVVCQSGFNSEFLEYFAVVDDEGSACGRAAKRRAQTVIVDVDDDPQFACHREIAAAARFRAVQSTPLIDPTGHLLGVLSTHFRRPQRPRERDLQIMQWYSELVGAAVAACDPCLSDVSPAESPASGPATTGENGLGRVSVRYCYAEDARRHAHNARQAGAESIRLHEDAIRAHEQVAVLHDHAVELYRQLAENTRRRGNGSDSGRSESLAARHRRRAQAARGRAQDARRAALLHEELQRRHDRSATNGTAPTGAVAITS